MVPRACIAIQLYTAIQHARIQLRYTAYSLYTIQPYLYADPLLQVQVQGTCTELRKKVAIVRGEPVRISSMVLFVAYAFYYRNAFSIVIYHHMPRERRCLRHPGPQQ